MSLAISLTQQGKHSRAEAICKQCLEKRKKVLGENHSDTLNTMHNLAATYADQARLSDAEVLYKQCLAKMKIVLGESHPRTMGTKESLASIYANQAIAKLMLFIQVGGDQFGVKVRYQSIDHFCM